MRMSLADASGKTAWLAHSGPEGRTAEVACGRAPSEAGAALTPVEGFDVLGFHIRRHPNAGLLELVEYRYALVDAGLAKTSDFTPLVVVLDEFAELREDLLEWYPQVKPAAAGWIASRRLCIRRAGLVARHAPPGCTCVCCCSAQIYGVPDR